MQHKHFKGLFTALSVIYDYIKIGIFFKILE